MRPLGEVLTSVQALPAPAAAIEARPRPLLLSPRQQATRELCGLAIAALDVARAGKPAPKLDEIRALVAGVFEANGLDGQQETRL